MSLKDAEQAWRALALGTDEAAAAAFIDVAADVDGERRALYRELVQNNLLGVIKRACPHALRLAGTAFVDVARLFLATQAITTRFTRQIPGEFTAWLMAQPATN